MVKSVVLRMGHNTPGFTLVAKWEMSPEWHIFNKCHSRQKFYCISICFIPFWTLRNCLLWDPVSDIHVQYRALTFNTVTHIASTDNSTFVYRDAVVYFDDYPGSKVHGANMGPTWGRQEPGEPHVGHMNRAIWVISVDTEFAVGHEIDNGEGQNLITSTITCWEVKYDHTGYFRNKYLKTTKTRPRN